jgi:hypothetical protein
MDLQPLLAPIPGDLPEGSSCQDERAFREMKPLGVFLVEQAKAREVERQSREPSTSATAADEKKMALLLLERIQNDLRERIAPAAKVVLGKDDPSTHTVAHGIQSRALALLKNHGKDLRVVVKLTLAQTAMQGIAGLADGAQLFEALVDQFGQKIHPQADEDGDLFERSKQLTELLGGQDLLAIVRQTVLAAASHTRLTVRDLDGHEGLLSSKESSDPVKGLTNDLDVLEAFAGAAGVAGGLKKEEVDAQAHWDQIQAQVDALARAVTLLQSLARKFRAPIGQTAPVFGLLERALKSVQSARLLLPLSQASLSGLRGLPKALELVDPLLVAEGHTLDSNRVLFELLAGERLPVLLRQSAVFPGSVSKFTLGQLDPVRSAAEAASQAPDRPAEAVLLDELTAVLATEQQVKPDDVYTEDKLDRLDSLMAPAAAALDALRALARAFRVAADAAPVLAQLERTHAALLRARLVLAPAPAVPLTPASPAAGSVPGAMLAGLASGDAAAIPGATQMAMLTPVGMLRTREDARLAILAIAAFLEQTEPAHPSSLFLHRAAKLLQARSFFDIVQELLPGSPVETISTLTGAKPPET